MPICNLPALMIGEPPARQMTSPSVAAWMPDNLAAIIRETDPGHRQPTTPELFSGPLFRIVRRIPDHRPVATCQVTQERCGRVRRGNACDDHDFDHQERPALDVARLGHPGRGPDDDIVHPVEE